MSIGVIDASLSPSDVLINGESIKDSWYFNRIFVKPQCRKRGIASKLMTEFMDSDLDHLQRDDWKEVIQIVADAPTVIEAEGSETE